MNLNKIRFRTSHDVFKEIGDLVRFLKETLNPMFVKHECDFAYLVGSWTRGSVLPWSDMDVFVSIPRILSLTKEAQLSVLLSLNAEAEMLTRLTNVDVRVLELLPLHVKMDAIRDEIVLFEANDHSRSAFLEHLMKHYNDHGIWYRRLLKNACNY